jgi:hypothetical protein
MMTLSVDEFYGFLMVQESHDEQDAAECSPLASLANCASRSWMSPPNNSATITTTVILIHNKIASMVITVIKVEVV